VQKQEHCKDFDEEAELLVLGLIKREILASAWVTIERGTGSFDKDMEWVPFVPSQKREIVAKMTESGREFWDYRDCFLRAKMWV